MRSTSNIAAVLFGVGVVAGCSGDAAIRDAGGEPRVDASAGGDAGAAARTDAGRDTEPDAGGADGGALERDAGAARDAAVDAGAPDAATPMMDAGADAGPCRDPDQCGGSGPGDFCTNCYANGGEVLPGEAGCWCASSGLYINAWFGTCPDAAPLCAP